MSQFLPENLTLQDLKDPLAEPPAENNQIEREEANRRTRQVYLDLGVPREVVESFAGSGARLLKLLGEEQIAQLLEDTIYSHYKSRRVEYLSSLVRGFGWVGLAGSLLRDVGLFAGWVGFRQLDVGVVFSRLPGDMAGEFVVSETGIAAPIHWEQLAGVFGVDRYSSIVNLALLLGFVTVERSFVPGFRCKQFSLTEKGELIDSLIKQAREFIPPLLRDKELESGPSTAFFRHQTKLLEEMGLPGRMGHRSGRYFNAFTQLCNPAKKKNYFHEDGSPKSKAEIEKIAWRPRGLTEVDIHAAYMCYLFHFAVRYEFVHGAEREKIAQAFLSGCFYNIAKIQKKEVFKNILFGQNCEHWSDNDDWKNFELEFPGLANFIALARGKYTPRGLAHICNNCERRIMVDSVGMQLAREGSDALYCFDGYMTRTDDPERIRSMILNAAKKFGMVMCVKITPAHEIDARRDQLEEMIEAHSFRLGNAEGKRTMRELRKSNGMKDEDVRALVEAHPKVFEIVMSGSRRPSEVVHLLTGKDRFAKMSSESTPAPKIPEIPKIPGRAQASS